MKSYTQLRNTYGVDTKNTSTANLTQGDEWMNDFHRRILTKADWPFLHRLRTTSTEADTDFVAMPYDVDQVESVFVTVGTTRYTPQPAPSRESWDELHYSSYTSDIPEYWFPYNGQLGLWPTPASAGNTISINCKIRVVDLARGDYTTGSIASATNGSSTIEGASSPSWTSALTGRWIKIEQDDTANSGDGLWYEISSVTDSDTLNLVREYGGTTFTGATQSYTIGQMPILPEAYHDMVEHYAAYRYWSKENDKRSAEFKTMMADGLVSLFDAYGVNDLSMVLDDGDDREIINPNLMVNL